jgi:2-phosphoglycerate kinase
VPPDASLTLGDGIVILSGAGQVAFSKGLMAQAFTATGLAPEQAYEVAAAVERSLRRRGGKAHTLGDLRNIARRILGNVEGDLLIERFSLWRSLRRNEVPVVILIGGATGVGKSTLATQLANRLGITRVTSTDMVRQVMRAFFAPELMPAIHASSFEAAESLQLPLPQDADLSRAGFVEQTKAVAVGVGALIERHVTEAHSSVIEGVHVVPGFLDLERWSQALILQFVVTVSDRARHLEHFAVREYETGGNRRLGRYAENLTQIRRIQKYIVARAREAGVPVIENESLDMCLREVMERVLAAAGEYHRSSSRPSAPGA